jgi:hypothetical protein
MTGAPNRRPSIPACRCARGSRSHTPGRCAPQPIHFAEGTELGEQMNQKVMAMPRVIARMLIGP